ncbi:MAG: hypothetical protein QOJ41_2864, partial [Acidobacteriaceae bacterium]|nr:hypothetical protein [Acidobacteriaceae bacterium]
VVRHNLVQQIIRAYEEWDVAHPAHPHRNSGTNASNGRGDRRVQDVAKELVSEQFREPGRAPDEPTGQDVK